MVVVTAFDSARRRNGARFTPFVIFAADSIELARYIGRRTVVTVVVVTKCHITKQ
jgi:hypothetical protein